MKLTKREAFLLKLVGFIALIAFSYYFVISPQLDKLAEVRLSLTEKTHEVESVKLEIQALSQMEQEINNLQEEIIVLSENFYPELQQKKLIVILDEQLRESGTKADSLGFTQIIGVENPNLIETDGTQGEQQSEEEVSPEEKSILPEIQSLSIDLPFTGNYLQIMELINRLEGMNRQIAVNNLQVAQGTDGTLNGSINLTFYSLNRLFGDPRDEEYLNWPYNTPKGTNNPFRSIPLQVEETEDDSGEGTAAEVSEQAESEEQSEA